MKTLVVCRHAKSDWGLGLPDIERPLNKRGLKDAPRMGKLLKDYKFSPDLIVSSPAVRARTTAELVASQLSYTNKIQIEAGIYESKLSWVMDLIRTFPDKKETVMLFGHNPTFEALIEQLLEMEGSTILPTGGMACLEMTHFSWKDVTPGVFSLKWFLIPRIVTGNPA